MEGRKPHAPSSSLITFLPRPVMLGARINSYVTVRERKQIDGSLLGSIARFLETNGFSRTLSVFQSEARRELDGLTINAFDLEGMFCKFLDSSRSPSEYNTDGNREQDGRISSDICEASTERKKRKKEEGNEEKGKSMTEADDNIRTKKDVQEASRKGKSVMTLEIEDSSLLERKGRKKKKKKKKKCFIASSQGNIDYPLGQGGKEITVHESLFDAPHVKSKRKRKKAGITCPLEENDVQVGPNVLHEFVEEKVDSLTSSLQNDLTELIRSGSKSKDRKKKTYVDCSAAISGGLGLESSHRMSKEKPFDGTNMDAQKPEYSVGNAQQTSDVHHTKIKSMDKKRKKKSSNLYTEPTQQLDEDIYQIGDNRSSILEKYYKDSSQTQPENKSYLLSDAGGVGKSKDSKRRKAYILTESSFDKELSLHESKQRNTGILGDYKDFLESVDGDENCMNKIEKKDRDEEISCKYLNVLPKVLVKDKARECTGQNDVMQHEQNNGEYSKKDKSGTSSNAPKTDKKLLAKSKVSKSFQRVKIEEVKFTDERLQNNSYWAKDGAGNGYGVKAQEILGQVRGRFNQPVSFHFQTSGSLAFRTGSSIQGLLQLRL